MRIYPIIIKGKLQGYYVGFSWGTLVSYYGFNRTDALSEFLA